jgi:tRNA pseudouridine65 synthase
VTEESQNEKEYKSDKDYDKVIPIEILHHDEEILVVHKPPFMMVHPWKGGPRKEKALMTHVKEQTGEWVYPVHRIDRQTSGIVLFALKPEIVTFYQDRWHSDEVQKKYFCLASGEISEEGRFNNQLKTPKGHKQDALTEYIPVEYFDHHQYPCTLCDVTIRTGRKHQIRRHFSRHMKNIIGDTRHGKGPINDFFRDEMDLHRLFLHAYYLKIPHPTKNMLLHFRKEMEEDLTGALDNFRKIIASGEEAKDNT